MLDNAQRWQNLDFVLQLPMESFLKTAIKLKLLRLFVLVFSFLADFFSCKIKIVTFICCICVFSC